MEHLLNTRMEYRLINVRRQSGAGQSSPDSNSWLTPISLPPSPTLEPPSTAVCTCLHATASFIYSVCIFLSQLIKAGSPLNPNYYNLQGTTGCLTVYACSTHTPERDYFLVLIILKTRGWWAHIRIKAHTTFRNNNYGGKQDLKL